MKNTISKQLRRLSVMIALFGMTFSILFPLNLVQRIAAAENLEKFEQTSTSFPIQKPDANQIKKTLGGIPVYFEENRGQQDERVKYMTRGGGTLRRF